MIDERAACREEALEPRRRGAGHSPRHHSRARAAPRPPSGWPMRAARAPHIRRTPAQRCGGPCHRARRASNHRDAPARPGADPSRLRRDAVLAGLRGRSAASTRRVSTHASSRAGARASKPATCERSLSLSSNTTCSDSHPRMASRARAHASARGESLGSADDRETSASTTIPLERFIGRPSLRAGVPPRRAPRPRSPRASCRRSRRGRARRS